MEEFAAYLKLVNNCDPQDPLLSSTSLGAQLGRISLDKVSPNDLFAFTQALNVEQLVPTDSGLSRDYRGLAELIGFSTIEIENLKKRSINYTRSIIDTFINNNLKHKHAQVSVNDLLKMVERLERFDIIDDLLPTLVKLAQNSANQLDLKARLAVESELDKGGKTTSNTSDLVKEVDMLTFGDTQSASSIYDAFVCYASEDFHYAQEMIELLEKNGKRIATADDLLPGQFEHDALTKLIDVRCRKVIIILTRNFIQSKECEFQTKFASELGIQARTPKIIPVICEAFDLSLLPQMIRLLSKIDLTNRAGYSWQLNKLLYSLGSEPPAPATHSSGSSTPVRRQTVHERPSIQLIDRSCNLTESQSHTNHPPAILLSADTQSYTNTNEPFVDLLQSQSSFVSDTSRLQDYEINSGPLRRTSSPLGSNKPTSWFRKAKQMVLGNSAGSISPSTSSRAILMTHSSDESLHRTQDESSGICDEI